MFEHVISRKRGRQRKGEQGKREGREGRSSRGTDLEEHIILDYKSYSLEDTLNRLIRNY